MPRDILDFWFPPDQAPDYAAMVAKWFAKDDDFDREISRRFRDTYERAAAGDLDAWREHAEGCLALVIILDQFPRNMFRGAPRAFATDDLARAIADHAIERGLDRELHDRGRQFLYLPFEHSEDLADQERCLALMKTLPGWQAENSAYDWARRHRDVIVRFGRFPHRNAVLGRTNTPEEERFLTEPGSSF